MALPSATLSIQDGALGIVPSATGKVGVVMGVCSKGTPATVYGAYRDIPTMVSALGYGPAVEAAALQLLKGGTCYVVPTTSTYDGAASAITKVGTGAGTITGISFAPLEQIVITCTTTGDLGTAAFTFKIGSGATSAPVTSAAGWSTSYVVAGAPLTRMTFVKGAGPTYYEAGDVFTISTTAAEGSNVAVVRTGASSGNITHTSEPVDDFTVLLEIRGTGAAGTGTFRYTLDNFTDDAGNDLSTWSADILIPSGQRYQLPNTGVVVAFSGGSFTDNDTHAFNIVAPGTNTTNVGAAFTALYAQSSLSYGFVHVAHMSTSAANAATLAGTVDTNMTTAQTAFRYIFGLVDVPTSGTRILSGGLAAASAEADATVVTAFASTTSTRCVYGAGDFLAVSALNARLCRRPASWQAAMESAARKISQNLHRVRTGPLTAVRRLYRDEGATEALDAGRFLTLRTHIGKAGVYITRGRTGADSTSDFSRLSNRRVMDRACEVVRSKIVDLIGETVPVNDDGTIKEKSAAAIEAEINNSLKAAVVDEGDASSSTVTVNRAWNVLSTGKLKVAVRVTPLGSTDEIETEIGFTNPNAVAA